MPRSALTTGSPDRGAPRLACRLLACVATCAVVLAASLATAGGALASDRNCRSTFVPAPDSGIAGAQLYGELCLPAGRPPRTVLLLVAGATYTHTYWDFPYEPQRYSFVDHALAAGYATFAVDRLGIGESTRPPSAQDTLAAGAAALHDVIVALRAGAVAGARFVRVAWVGHSYGSIYAWIEASLYHDVDAFVLTGLLHAYTSSFVAKATGDLYPAIDDPKFADSGLDPGYLTSVPGTRASLFYYTPGADPRVIALDEQLKDTVTATELAEGIPLSEDPPAASAPSQDIDVPTMLVVGQEDDLFCPLADGQMCTAQSVLAQEQPYYSARAHLSAAVIPSTGHDLNLHLSAPYTDGLVLSWLYRTLAPG